MITFVCYGSHLHGDDEGSVDRNHRVPRTPLVFANTGWESSETNRMEQAPFELDRARREEVLRTLRDVSTHHGWKLLAAHIRSTHVHLVIEAEVEPERVMNAFKSYASRSLNQLSLDPPDRKRWARHGSTRYLWEAEKISAAIHYVVHEQGEAMSVFELEK